MSSELSPPLGDPRLGHPGLEQRVVARLGLDQLDRGDQRVRDRHVDGLRRDVADQLVHVVQARAQVRLARPGRVVEQAVQQRVRVAAALLAFAGERVAEVAQQGSLVDPAARAERVDHAQRVVEERVVDEPLVGECLGEDRLGRLTVVREDRADVLVRGLAVEVALAVAHERVLGHAVVEAQERVLLVRLVREADVQVQPDEADRERLQVGLEPLALTSGREVREPRATAERVVLAERGERGHVALEVVLAEEDGEAVVLGDLEEGGVVDDRQVRGGGARLLADDRLVQALGLDGAAQLLRQRDAHRVRHPRVQAELELVRPVAVVDRADGARGRDRGALRAEVDHRAGGEQLRRGPREEAGFPRVDRDEDAAARCRFAPELRCEPRSGRAGRAVVHDAIGVHRQPMQREVRLELRRERREPAAQPLRRGVQRVAEHEGLVGLDERERLGREQAVQVRRARLDVRADAVDARVHPVEQRLRRGARFQLLADPTRELGRRDADRAEPVVQRVRAVQQLGLHAELGEDRAILPERRTPALTQKAVQQRRCGRQCSGILARRGKQPAES